MMQATQRRPRGKTRFPGIITDARQLRVNRCTLYRALTGQWKLPGLMGRYRALKEQQREAASNIGTDAQ